MGPRLKGTAALCVTYLNGWNLVLQAEFMTQILENPFLRALSRGIRKNPPSKMEFNLQNVHSTLWEWSSFCRDAENVSRVTTSDEIFFEENFSFSTHRHLTLASHQQKLENERAGFIKWRHTKNTQMATTLIPVALVWGILPSYIPVLIPPFSNIRLQ